MRELRSLTRLLQTHKDTIARERCRLANGDAVARREARLSIGFGQKRAAALQARIDQLLAAGPELARKVALVDSILCVGKVTAQTVVAELPPHIQSARQAAAYAGVTPGQDDSGTRKGRARLCKTGNPHLRKALYRPAVSGRKSNDRLRDLAGRRKEKGRLNTMQIIGACMHLLMRLCYGVLASGQPYQPDWTSGRKA